jgi:hypothetical protein
LNANGSAAREHAVLGSRADQPGVRQHTRRWRKWRFAAGPGRLSQEREALELEALELLDGKVELLEGAEALLLTTREVQSGEVQAAAVARREIGRRR